MQIYLIILPVIVFIYLFTMNRFFYSKKTFVIISFTLLGFISAFRGNIVGTDVYSYQEIFMNNIQGGNLGDLQNKSKGYYIFSRIVGYYSATPQAITISCSVLVSALVGYFIYKNSKQVLLSTFLFVSLYFFADSLNGVRQFIAISLVINAHYLMIYEKKIRALLTLFLALSFHLTAIIGIFILIIDKINWNIKKFSILTVVLLIISGAYNQIFNFFTSHLSTYSLYASFTNESSEKGKLIFIFLIYLISIFTLVILEYNKKISLSNGDYSILVIYYIGVLFSVIFFYNTFMFQLIRRLLLYFNIFGILYFPIFSDKISSLSKYPKTTNNIIICSVMLVTFYTYFSSLNSNMNGIVPYITFFQK